MISKTALGLFVNGSITKTLMSGNIMKTSSVILFRPGNTLFAQYSSEQDGTNSQFYCPPGSEEFCIAGHMPGFEAAVSKGAKEENTISNHIDSCVVGPNSKVWSKVTPQPSGKRIIPCLASVKGTKK